LLKKFKNITNCRREGREGGRGGEGGWIIVIPMPEAINFEAINFVDGRRQKMSNCVETQEIIV
jgi:hypothetical protein